MQGKWCANCKNHYTNTLTAHQLINCSHTLCKRCLISQPRCGACAQPVGLDDYHLADYKVIHPSSKMTDSNIGEEEGENGVQKCLLHGKPADLICIDDEALICCNCALFGEHKGHQVINREGLLNKMTSYVEQCLAIYQQVKTVEEQFNKNVYESKFGSILHTQHERNKQAIDQKFKKLSTSVQIAHKKSLLKLQNIYKQKEEKMRQGILFDQIEAALAKWYTEIQHLGSLMNDFGNLEQLVPCIPYLDDSGKGDEIMDEGDRLIQEISKMKTQAQKLYEEESNQTITEFSEEISKTLESFCQFVQKKTLKQNKDQGQPILLSTNKSPATTELQRSEDPHPDLMNFEPLCHKAPQQHSSGIMKESIGGEVNLLESVARNYCNVEQSGRIAMEVHIQNIPLLSISDIKPVANGSSYPSSDRSRFFPREKQLQDIGNTHVLQIDPQKKKKGKLDHIPQKFKGIVQDLKNDRAETIDLTGADLGDANLGCLCPFIRKSKKLKILKLIKNKLTDECIPELLLSLSESKVTNVNLSQNMLTDKICEYLGEVGVSLKTVTLTLNKINRRGVKGKIEQLGKRGLNVLL